MIVYPARDIRPFVMYCINGKPHSSLLIESTDSMIFIRIFSVYPLNKYSSAAIPLDWTSGDRTFTCSRRCNLTGRSTKKKKKRRRRRRRRRRVRDGDCENVGLRTRVIYPQVHMCSLKNVYKRKTKIKYIYIRLNFYEC